LPGFTFPGANLATSTSSGCQLIVTGGMRAGVAGHELGVHTDHPLGMRGETIRCYRLFLPCTAFRIFLVPNAVNWCMTESARTSRTAVRRFSESITSATTAWAPVAGSRWLVRLMCRGGRHWFDLPHHRWNWWISCCCRAWARAAAINCCGADHDAAADLEHRHALAERVVLDCSRQGGTQVEHVVSGHEVCGLV
jgi:hypothetical protein